MPTTGTVKFFDARPDRMCGYFVVPGGEDVKYFLSAGKGVAVENYRIVWKDVPAGKRMRTPNPGDKVVFEVGGSMGTLAVNWTFQDHYASVQVALNRSLVTRPEYRVWERMDSRAGQGEPKVLWQGWDMEALMKRYPLPRGRQSPSADPLLSFWSHDDGFEVHRWWETKIPGGEWGPCKDPRPLPGVLRTFEAICR